MRALAFLPLLLLVGCPASGDPFLLADLERVVVGQSTREEVEAALGRPAEESLPGVAVYRSELHEVVPAFPYHLLSWPLFLAHVDAQVLLVAHYDPAHVLRAGWVSFDQGFTFNLLLLLPGCGTGPPDAAQLTALQRIGANGFQVRVWTGEDPERPWVDVREVRDSSRGGR